MFGSNIRYVMFYSDFLFALSKRVTRFRLICSLCLSDVCVVPVVPGIVSHLVLVIRSSDSCDLQIRMSTFMLPKDVDHSNAKDEGQIRLDTKNIYH